ncbi:MAG: glucosyltransferase [Devosia sp.]|nr:glucosyltransferase [Devosia sp.]
MSIAGALLLSFWGGWLHLRYVGGASPDPFDVFRTVLFAVAVFWLAWGASIGFIGLLGRPMKARSASRGIPTGRTAILMPVYNEDTVATLARIAVMNRGLVALGAADRFHFVVLSDSTAADIAAREIVMFERLLREPLAMGRMFYRRRDKNLGRKAGNIEDFVTRAGGAYDYALVLDADSLMEPATIIEMACRMDDDATLGLLQSVPSIVGAQSLFGRCLQFGVAYLSPTFSRGVAAMQGREGPYWGHNAIIRITAFAGSCGLPVLSGRAPSGGHILSHDFVEGALLARDGWTVVLDPTLTGSYEEGPDNLIEFAKRDRRWCQGNLQHRRLLRAPGLRFWSRFNLLHGLMSYLTSPLWLLLLSANVTAAIYDAPPVDSAIEPDSVWLLISAVAAILLLPKLLVFLVGVFDGTNRQFGGNFATLRSLLAEIVLSTLLAPIMLLFQSRAVIQTVLGIDGGWPAAQRSGEVVSVQEAVTATWWMSLCGGAAIVIMLALTPDLFIWLAPVTVPSSLAPLLIALSSRAFASRWWFESPNEAPAGIVEQYRAFKADLSEKRPAFVEPTQPQIATQVAA